MAILFDKGISVENLLFAFNNNIIRFYSDNVLAPTNCELEIVTIEAVPRIVTLNLYPSPAGKFYFNLKEIILSLMNLDKFKDDFETLGATPVGYGNWDKLILIADLNFKINFANESFDDFSIKDVSFISAYQNLDSKMTLLVSRPIFLTNFKTLSNLQNISRLKYWQGYPFDITIYTDKTNPTNILNRYDLVEEEVIDIIEIEDIIQSIKTQRLRLSNGLVQQGFLSDNKKYYQLSLANDESLSSDLIIEKIIPDCENKHYLKWINPLGGWNYFLFKKGRINLTTKGIGEINNDFENIEDTISPTENIGVLSQKNIIVYEDCNEDDIVLMAELLENPKVYLFTGKPNTSATYKDWIEVTVKEKSNKIQDAKQNFVRVDLEIELPKRITRTL